MSIVSNEDTFTYKVEASKSKEGYYKVSLINQTNNHEQVILKNKDGVYVVTPDLNKSFKFQSDWPNNGSQSYLLDVLLNDCFLSFFNPLSVCTFFWAFHAIFC